MQIVTTDTVIPVTASSSDRDRPNPLQKLLSLVERVDLAAEREWYLMETAQYLFPFDTLVLSGPNPPHDGVCDPTQQDDKTNLQQQTILDFQASDTYLMRGWVRTGEITVPFLKASYRAGPDSRLAKATRHQLGATIQLWLKVGDAALAAPVRVPYNPTSERYEIECWGYQGDDLRAHLDDKGRAALDEGRLLVRPDLIRGNPADFASERVPDRYVVEVATTSAMHPVRPLSIEVAWGDTNGATWDAREGANYHYEFAMLVRGWEHFLRVGVGQNPHGGAGTLEYRNLLSNYGQYSARPELGRTLAPWNYDAFGRKPPAAEAEPFLAIQYMDLHRLKAGSGIGLHRHRDNPDVFLLMEGQGYMITGDWCKQPQRERCFEIRTLRAGHLALIQGGQLHGLMNPGTGDLALFTFGGYD
jgi:hypothetical protein